jgi:hypothetical protein
MRFKGPPNTKFNVHKPKYGEPGAIRFNADGVFETHNRFLARRMARKFEIIPDEPERPAPQPEQTPETAPTAPQMKKCKKCDFECENQGDLLAHYRKEHPNK